MNSPSGRARNSVSSSQNLPNSEPGAIAPCQQRMGELIVVDEIGRPLANTPVTLRVSDGRVLNLTTDATGKIAPNLPEGTTGELELGNIHEAAEGDSTQTGSGQHFAMQ